MTIPTSLSWRRDLQTIFNAGTLAGLSDGQLLERIAALRGIGRGENTEVDSAFALLIERHGPMVLRVCRGVLGDPHEADDAFQATFLVLLRQAGTIRKRESVGPWLHGVAHRVAACARSAAARRRVHERRWFDRRQEATSKASNTSETQDFELVDTIHAELDRLPERYRAPIVLCDLEERSLDKAARQLGWPLGTVKSRLNRGRQQLRDRLVRRGIAPGVVGPMLAGSDLIRSTGPAIAISPTLAEITAQMIHSAETVARGSSASVLALARGVQRAMLMTKLKTTVVGLIVAGLTAIGIGAMASGPRLVARDDAPARAGATKPKQQPEKIAKRTDENAKQAPRKTGHDDDESHIETIEISGRATDPSGRPVAGATVYVINTNNGRRRDESPLLTTVITGRDGRFVASGVKLLVPKFQPSPVPGVGESHFQVAGTAPGFGFTWHEVACYRPTARPPAEAAPRANTIEAFYQGEPIAIDLAFGPPASLQGKIVDDRGRPIAGTKVQAGLCDDPRMPLSKTSTCVRVDPTNTINSYYRRRFDGIGALPDSLFSTRTGPDGTYKLEGLPRDAQLLTWIDPGPEYDPWSEMIATTTLPVEDVESIGYDLVFRHVHSLGADAVLNRTFAAPRETRFTVRYADTNLPAKKATIRATRKHEMFRGGHIGETDANGQATLRLRPGGYGLAIEPPPGAPYLPGRASSRLDLRDDLKLDPAALVTLEAVDAKTGAGIEGVSFQYETDKTPRRHDLRSQLVFVDHPVTDERGRLRAVVEPGRRQFFVGTIPPGWKFEGTSTGFIELVAGRESTIRFAFKRIEEPAVAVGRGSSLFPEDLIEKWRRQQGMPRSGKVRIRRFFYSLHGRPIPVDDLEAFLDATDLSTVRDPAAALSAGLPSLPKPDFSVDSEIIEDGWRQRNTNRTLTSPSETTIAVSNGLEVVSYDCANAHADIFGVNQNSRPAVFGFRNLSTVFGVPNFRSWLFKDFLGAASSFFEGGDVTRIVAGDQLTIKQEKDHATGRWVVDLTTGFVYVHSWRSSRENVLGELIRQYGPKPFSHRFVLPTVHVEAHLQGLNVNRLNIIVLDEVNLDYRPDPHDFVVAAPAGTAILDNRQDRENPKRATCNYPVADVIMFSKGISSRDRPFEPVLNPGQPAPPIKPASWLDQNGPTGPPDVAGKVVLIDFWGVGSEPCVAELPGVQAAADRFAAKSKDVVLIGMHVSGNTVEAVAEFARKRGLTYRLAIDRPANGTTWFGATFRAYDVRTIPSAALIDRQGKVVFIGQLREALESAANLLGP